MKLKNKNDKILEANKLLERKISGQNEISSNYLNNISYKNNKADDQRINDLDGIIFFTKIIKYFRTRMYPKVTANDLMYKFPDVFSITFGSIYQSSKACPQLRTFWAIN